MTDKVKAFLDELRSREYRKVRVDGDWEEASKIFEAVPIGLRNAVMTEAMLHREVPYFLPGDRFGFNRTVKELPYDWTDKEDGSKQKQHTFDGNVTPNWKSVMERGLDDVLRQISALSEAADEEQRDFYEAMRRSTEAVLDLADRYRTAAVAEGYEELAVALGQVPHGAARSFYEACVFFKILIFAFRCSGMNHLTFGRFDQYMYDYYAQDLKRGVSHDELLETLELFFISINLDTDLYRGVQTGDNGQSMVLGGLNRDGSESFNDLSALCMDASLELSLIDPKVNLRVNRKTPISLYEYGTKMTKKGLGFPQYCNDDVIIPYLTSLGYEEADAYNYTVAACWEVISPNNGADRDNNATLNFPKVVNAAIHAHLKEDMCFDELLGQVRTAILDECEALRRSHPTRVSHRNFLLSIAMDGCLEKGRDFTRGGTKYYNYGCHGAGIANATDALAAVRQTVFEEKSVTADELLEALDRNFEGYEALRNRLLSCPKMGNNEDSVDSLADFLMTAAEDGMHGKPNGHFGGVWRMGTGSAMEYILSAKSCPATADGRCDGEAYACSFSPSLSAKLNGPLSVIQSFTKHKMTRISNGGPLTLELHDTVFRNEEGEKKVAQLVKLFIELGGHQLQLNAVNRDRLLDAQAHPENYPNLIVRVWGWSGYFCELDPMYQNHIIRRTEFSV